MEQQRTEILLGVGLGIAGIAVGGFLKLLQWRGNKIALVKKDPYSYNDYNSLRSDLVCQLRSTDDPQLSDVIIQGEVKQLGTQFVEYSREDFCAEGAARLDIITNNDKGKSIQKVESSSVSFQLADANDARVIVEKLQMAQALATNNQVLLKVFEGREYSRKDTATTDIYMLSFGSTLAVMGDIMFRDSSSDIILYPKKVGKSVESLIAKDETIRLDKITSTILIIGGASILLLIFGIKRVMPWIKSKLQRKKIRKEILNKETIVKIRPL